MSIEEDRFRHFANKPFVPPLAHTGALDTSIALRVANALEYIAAQLGDINQKLDKVIEAETKISESLSGVQPSVVKFLSQLKP